MSTAIHSSQPSDIPNAAPKIDDLDASISSIHSGERSPSASDSGSGKSSVTTLWSDEQNGRTRGNSIESELSLDWTEEKENVINEPFYYVSSFPGKEIRKQLLHAFNVWLKVDEENCETIARAVSMCHNASLMIDDIQDGSKLRRGAPSTHEVHGIAQTINSANYVYFQAQAELRKLPNASEACDVFTDEMLNLHRGQGMELHWRDHCEPPSKPDYLQMIANKTGGLFRLILRLLQTASPRKDELNITPLANVIGLLFQILDDYKSLREDKMAEAKGYCEDLTEGKFSFPINHAIWENDPKKDEILSVLKSKTEDNAVKAYVVDCLKESGSFAYTRKVLEDLNDHARVMMDDLKEPNPMLEGLLDKLMGVLQSC